MVFSEKCQMSRPMMTAGIEQRNDFLALGIDPPRCSVLCGAVARETAQTQICREYSTAVGLKGVVEVDMAPGSQGCSP